MNYNFSKLPKSTREFSSFLNLILTDALETLPDSFTLTYIRCHKKGCHGTISSKIDLAEDILHWKCSVCSTSGTITNAFGELTI